MAEVGRYNLMTREQEHDVAVRYRETGDPKAAEQLVTSNLRFVVKVAAEYSKFGARLIDLIQEGNVGLMHAVKEFNPYKGTRLITYRRLVDPRLHSRVPNAPVLDGPHRDHGDPTKIVLSAAERARQIGTNGA